MKRTSVVIVNDSKLGSRPVIAQPKGPRVELSQPAKTKRLFPREHETTTPDFNHSPPLISTGAPNKKNGYTNGYSSSILGLTVHAQAPTFFLDSY